SRPYRSTTITPVLCIPFFLFNNTSPPEIYTLSLHDALPISQRRCAVQEGHLTGRRAGVGGYCRDRRGERHRLPEHGSARRGRGRSEEHTSELQSLRHLVCRLLLEKKKKKQYKNTIITTVDLR